VAGALSSVTVLERSALGAVGADRISGPAAGTVGAEDYAVCSLASALVRGMCCRSSATAPRSSRILRHLQSARSVEHRRTQLSLKSRESRICAPALPTEADDPGLPATAGQSSSLCEIMFALVRLPPKVAKSRAPPAFSRNARVRPVRTSRCRAGGLRMWRTVVACRRWYDQPRSVSASAPRRPNMFSAEMARRAPVYRPRDTGMRRNESAGYTGLPAANAGRTMISDCQSIS
jgi:hypothetical protein